MPARPGRHSPVRARFHGAMLRRMKPFLICGALLLGGASLAPLAAQSGSNSPESLIRALVTSMYANDVATYEKLTLPDPRRARLTAGGRVNEEALRELKEDPGSLQIKMKRPYLFQGKPVKPDARGNYPVGTTVLFRAAHRGGPMTVPLVRRDEGWRVDVRWWVAMIDLMSGAMPKRGTADYAARALAGALVTLDRQSAIKLVMPGSDLAMLFDGAPRQREPSGVLEASVAEMPLVRIGPGEFYPMPSGRIVEGTNKDDEQVLVGLFGPTEIPFVVHNVKGEWRVEAEPYYMLLLG